MLPCKIFEILHAVMAILVLFEYFSRKFSLNFLTLILSASPNMMDAFYLHIFDYTCLRHKAYRYQRGLKLWKNCVHQKILKMAGGRIHRPTPSSFLAISCRNHQKNRSYSIFQSLGTTNFVLFY